jgi:hypothetical protein
VWYLNLPFEDVDMLPPKTFAVAEGAPPGNEFKS